MSISLLLVPLVIAGATAAQGLSMRRDAAGQTVCEVRTRMRDANLLAAALSATGAAVEPAADAMVAHWEGVTARFSREIDGIWSTHFTGAVDRDRAVEIVEAIDAAYGRQVQQAVLTRLRERAPGAGLRLESEAALPNDEVKLVFAVERRSS